MEFFEKERSFLGEELKSKENFYRIELEKLEISFETFKKMEEVKLLKEQEISYKAKSKIANLESIII